MTKEEIIEKIFTDNLLGVKDSIKDRVGFAMEEYSSQQSTEFAEWIMEKGWQQKHFKGEWVRHINQVLESDPITTEHLYQLFCQHKSNGL